MDICVCSYIYFDFRDDEYKEIREIKAKKDEFKEEEKELGIKEPKRILKNSEMGSPNIDISNFRDRVLEDIKKITYSINLTNDQKKTIFLESEKILNKHISRAVNEEINIPINANPTTNAAAIIYVVLKSKKNISNIVGLELYKKAGISKSPFYVQYKKYKQYAPEFSFDFYSAQLGRSRIIFSYYFFSLLNNGENDLKKLVLYLDKVEISKIISCLREIFIESNKQLNQREKHLLEQLKDREIKNYKDMASNHSNTFIKYFSDLVNIIKLMIILNKSHRIIDADFSAQNFSRFLIEKGINLYLKEDTLAKAILNIYNFLNKRYPDLFPPRVKTGNGWASNADESGHIRARVVGSRIKIYIMKHIYKGKYFDQVNKIAVCPDCLGEDLILNTSFPRIRSKEFHHMDIKLQGYSINELYSLFVDDRGNPFFLEDLIKKMEDESVVLKCTSHHSNVKAIHFENFKKLISWEEIPKEFPYEDIFDLPAEIIHILVKISVDSFPLPDPLPGPMIVREQNINERRLNVRKYVIDFLKERYIIDHIYGGVCPVCREFNTKEHLPAFEYSHLYKKSELTPEERKKRMRLFINYLYRTFNCSDIVKEMEKRYQKGGYLCANCHKVVHKDISFLDKIYNESNILKNVLEDKRNTMIKHEKNLIFYKKSIKNPLEPERVRYKTFMEYLIALYEISKSKRKNEGVTRKELKNYLGLGTKTRAIYIFENREISKKYLKKVDGNPIKYYINDEGIRIVHLMYYFRDYYNSSY